MEQPQDGSWELADSLMQTLSAPLPPDSPVAASYKDMMHQLKTDVTSALLACQDKQTMHHASHLLSSTERPAEGSWSSMAGQQSLQHFGNQKALPSHPEHSAVLLHASRVCRIEAEQGKFARATFVLAAQTQSATPVFWLGPDLPREALLLHKQRHSQGNLIPAQGTHAT